MSAMTQRAQERDEIEGLLPWHAAGTLTRANAGRVGRALAGDPELARRFERVREELAETIHLNESLGVPSARAMQKLFAAIDAEGVTRRKPGFALALRTRVAETFAALNPRALGLACVAALALVVLQASVIGDVVLNESKLFRIATSHSASAPPRAATDVRSAGDLCAPGAACGGRPIHDRPWGEDRGRAARHGHLSGPLRQSQPVAGRYRAPRRGHGAEPQSGHLGLFGRRLRTCSGEGLPPT